MIKLDDKHYIISDGAQYIMGDLKERPSGKKGEEGLTVKTVAGEYYFNTLENAVQCYIGLMKKECIRTNEIQSLADIAEYIKELEDKIVENITLDKKDWKTLLRKVAEDV